MGLEIDSLQELETYPCQNLDMHELTASSGMHNFCI